MILSYISLSNQKYKKKIESIIQFTYLLLWRECVPVTDDRRELQRRVPQEVELLNYPRSALEDVLPQLSLRRKGQVTARVQTGCSGGLLLGLSRPHTALGGGWQDPRVVTSLHATGTIRRRIEVVCSDMILQIQLCREAFATIGVRAFKWFEVGLPIPTEVGIFVRE